MRELLRHVGLLQRGGADERDRRPFPSTGRPLGIRSGVAQLPPRHAGNVVPRVRRRRRHQPAHALMPARAAGLAADPARVSRSSRPGSGAPAAATRHIRRGKAGRCSRNKSAPFLFFFARDDVPSADIRRGKKRNCQEAAIKSSDGRQVVSRRQEACLISRNPLVATYMKNKRARTRKRKGRLFFSKEWRGKRKAALYFHRFVWLRSGSVAAALSSPCTSFFAAIPRGTSGCSTSAPLFALVHAPTSDRQFTKHSALRFAGLV